MFGAQRRHNELMSQNRRMVSEANNNSTLWREVCRQNSKEYIDAMDRRTNVLKDNGQKVELRLSEYEELKADLKRARDSEASLRNNLKTLFLSSSTQACCDSMEYSLLLNMDYEILLKLVASFGGDKCKDSLRYLMNQTDLYDIKDLPINRIMAHADKR